MKEPSKKKPVQSDAPMKAAMRLTKLQATATDPQGSYTGVAEIPYEKPVQDADDL